MLKAFAVLGTVAFVMLGSAFVLGWSAVDRSGAASPDSRDAWHVWLGAGAMAVSALQTVALGILARFVVRDWNILRVLRPLALLMGIGTGLTAFSLLLGRMTLSGWSTYWHLAAASSALSYNAGIVLLGWLAVRAQGRAASNQAPPPRLPTA